MKSLFIILITVKFCSANNFNRVDTIIVNDNNLSAIDVLFNLRYNYKIKYNSKENTGYIFNTMNFEYYDTIVNEESEYSLNAKPIIIKNTLKSENITQLVITYGKENKVVKIDFYIDKIESINKYISKWLFSIFLK